jgi:hypothetical protein
VAESSSPPDEANPASGLLSALFDPLPKSCVGLAQTIAGGETGDKLRDIPTPQTCQEALQGPWATEWLESIMREFNGLQSTGTFEEVPRSTATNVIKSKWVFKIKRTPTGQPFFKSRLVAKGFSQKQGVDFFETWAPAAKHVTARAMLHLAAHLDLELHAMDVDQAFLQGDLEEDLFMEAPPGLPDLISTGSVWRLRKPLYGLKQSPRQWHAKLKGVLLTMGFKASAHDPSLFLKKSADHQWILVYVDDLLLLAPNSQAIQAFKEQLRVHFPLKDLGPLSTYLGMEVYRDRPQRLIYLHQAHYIDTIKHRFKDFLEVNHNLTLPDGTEEPVPGQDRFPELIGSLVYLMTCTRPDIAHALSVLGRFVGEGRHGPRHWAAGLRVLGYVAHTSSLQLTLGGAESSLQGFTDSSCQDDKLDRRSSQGYSFTLGTGVISWKATRSPAVALSSCEAELYAGTAAAQELL